MEQSTPLGDGTLNTLNSRAAIGDTLRAARLGSGMSVADISQTLRISRDFIKQLESGEFYGLPSPTYVSGYIRSYGAAVGIRAETINKLVEEYYGQLEEGAKTPTYRFPIGNQRPRRSGALAASIAVLLAVGGYTGWYFMDRPQTIEDVLSENAQTALVTPEIESTMTESGALGGGADARPDQITGFDETEDNDVLPLVETVQNGAQSDNAEGLSFVDDTQIEIAGVGDADNSRLVKPPLEPDGDDVQSRDNMDKADLSAYTQSETEPGLPLAGTIETASASAGASVDLSLDSGEIGQELKPDQGSAIANQRDPANELTLRALSSSWVEIVRNDGEEVMTRLMRAGDTYLIDASDSLYLSTGNAGGLEFVFNDGTIKAVGETGEIVRDLPLLISGLKAKL